MIYDRAGCIDVSKQDADPKVVTSPVVKHAVLYPYRDQLMNVEIPANREVVLANARILGSAEHVNVYGVHLLDTGMEFVIGIQQVLVRFRFQKEVDGCTLAR
jgi:hypothetical protein